MTRLLHFFQEVSRPGSGQSALAGSGLPLTMTDTSRRTKLSDAQVAEVCERVANNDASVSGEARRLGVARSTLRSAIASFERRNSEEAALELDLAPGGVAYTIDKRPPEGGWTDMTLLEAHGLDTEAWEIVSVKAVGNQWGRPDDPNEQVKLAVHARPATLLSRLRMADPSDWEPLPPPKKQTKADYVDVVVKSDHHAPFNNKEFHRLFVAMLEDTQPGIIEVNGDLLDFETISRHRDRDEAADVNTCIQAGFGILRDYREACPDALIRFKRGNHEERLRNLIVDNAKNLHRITPADSDLEALSLRRLLRLDDLHVEYIDEPWDQAKTALAPALTARHGVSTSKNAGEQMLDRLRGSTVQGHDHRAGITLRTEYTGDPDDPITVKMGVQGGCGCDIPGGLGYVAGGEPNWQNAYSAFRIYDDGDWHASLGIYLSGRLLAHNGKRYR